jgi:hypothetical protein
MELGVASRLVSNSVLRANKTGLNMFVGGADGNGASIEHSRFEGNDVDCDNSAATPRLSATALRVETESVFRLRQRQDRTFPYCRQQESHRR